MPLPNGTPLGMLFRPYSLALLVLAVLPSTIRAQGVTLEVQPNSLPVLASRSDLQVRVILKNTGETPVTKVSLSALNTDGLTVEIRAPSAHSAAKGQAVVWPLVLKNFQSTRLPLTILFEAKYYGQEKAAQCAYASLQMSAQQEANQKPVEVSVEGNFGAISEQRPAPGFLVVTNNLDVPVHIEVHPSTTRDIQVGQMHTTGNQQEEFGQIPPFDVPPRSLASTRIDFQAQSKIIPGTYPVLLELSCEWHWGGHTEQRQLVVAKQATVGVFFESELLKALGIPSFLVLPGCLVIFTIQLLLTFGLFGLKNDSRIPQLTATSPSFWVLAITFSGLFALVYNSFSANNYLIRYGLSDLLNVWLLSIGLGLVLYIAIAVCYWKYRRDHVFTRDDSQITVLRKMSRNGFNLKVPQAKIKVNNVEQHAFVIEAIEDGQTMVWVAPLIVTEWGSGNEALQAQRAFENSLNVKRGPDALAQLAADLDKAKQAGYVVDIRWNTQGSPPNPLHVKIETIVEYIQADIIITVV